MTLRGRIQLSSASTLILGDGTAPGLVIVRQAMLRQICEQMNPGAAVAPAQHLGLLLGPGPQSDDVLVEGVIPLDSEYGFARSLEMLRAGIGSVQPLLAKAWQEQSQTIVGFYRILTPGEDASENSFNFLDAGGEDPSSIPNLRCCFILAGLSASETLLRVLMRKGEQWERIQELTLQSETSPTDLAPVPPPENLNGTEPSRTVRLPPLMGEKFRRIDRVWVGGPLIAVLLFLLAANILAVRSMRRAAREKVNLQTLMDQIGELTAAVSKLQASAVAPEPPSTAAISSLEPPVAALVAPKTEPRNRQPAKGDVRTKRVSNPPTGAGNIAIVRKPAIIRPSEIFQFTVTGNPVPRVVWSSQGPGSIDPVYGLYRAPSQFTGESSVKIMATSWKGSQSVTFTLRGVPQGDSK